MKLKKITIENFRCFETLDIGFEEDVNVIVGVNGAGKTALLDVITVALCEVAIPRVPSARFQKDRKGYHYGHYAHVFCSSDDIYVDPHAKDVFSGRRGFVQISTLASLGDQEYSWTQRLQENNANEFALKYSDITTPVHHYMDNLWYSAKENLEFPIPVAVYYLAQRRLAKTPHLGDIFNVKLERVNAFQDALHAGVDYMAACQWFYLRENAELRERIEKENTQFQYHDLKSVREALGNVIEGLERIYFDNSTPPRLMVDVRKKPTNDTDFVERLALDQVSDGYRNLLALVIDYARRLAMANPFIPNPLEVPGILMIDEIELHLHPKWQQTIIPNLRKAFPNTQIIVTTHSPQVLTTVDNRCIRLLKDNKVYTTDEFTKGAESKRVLEHVLGTASRPPDSEIGKTLDKIFDLIDKGNLDEAERSIKEIDYLKTYETSLLEAESLIACKRWEQEEGL